MPSSSVYGYVRQIQLPSRTLYVLVISYRMLAAVCVCPAVAYLIHVVLSTQEGQTSTPLMLLDRTKQTDQFGTSVSCSH